MKSNFILTSVDCLVRNCSSNTQHQKLQVKLIWPYYWFSPNHDLFPPSSQFPIAPPAFILRNSKSLWFSCVQSIKQNVSVQRLQCYYKFLFSCMLPSSQVMVGLFFCILLLPITRTFKSIHALIKK